jgi:hypothetical protein
MIEPILFNFHNHNFLKLLAEYEQFAGAPLVGTIVPAQFSGASQVETIVPAQFLSIPKVGTIVPTQFSE